MTNEEIINKLNSNSNEVGYSYTELLSSIELARKDERDRVIGEIEGWLDLNIVDESLWFGKALNDKLNQIREQIK